MAVGATALVGVFRYAIAGVAGNVASFLPFIAAVMIASWWGGLGPGLAASALGALVAADLFEPPYGSLQGTGLPEAIGVAVFLVTSVVVCGLCAALRRSTRALRAERNLLEASLAQRRQADEALRASQESERARVAELEERLEAELSAMARLQAVSTHLVQGDEVGALLPDILDAAMAITGADMGAIQLLQRESATLEIAVQRGFEAPFLEFFRSVHAGEATAGTALQRGARVVVEDVTTSPIFAGTAALQVLLDAGVRAVQSTPLIDRSGRLVGMLTTHHRRPHVPAPRDLRVLDLFARQAADWIARTQAAAETRANAERLRLAQQVARIGTFDLDIQTGVNTWTPELEEIYGLEPGAFSRTQAAWEALVHPEDRADVVERVREAFENGAFAHEWRVIWPDGSVHWLAGRAVLFRDEAGRPARMLGVNIDITERKSIEQKLEETDRRKDEFLATLAHELRNPLAPIRNALQILKRERPAVPEVAWARDVIDRQTQHMVRLIDDLMDVARITSGALHVRKLPTELAPIIRSVLEYSRGSVEAAGIEVQVEMPSEPVVVEADAERLTQVFTNLLGNAAKFTASGGRIRLRLEREAQHARVSVQDTGVGIPPAMLERIFDLFVQVDCSLERAQGGLGVGLTLVKRLVELHGGSIEAHSDGPGRGSEFVVHLPLRIAAPLPATAGQSGKGSSGPRRRILVADDNPDASASLGLLLRVEGHEIRTANDGQEALSIAREFHPDVALLDIGMPGLNGYEVARRIREEAWGEHVFLVAVTGWSQPEDRRRTLEAGFDHHMVKPVDLGHLAGVIARATPVTA